MSNPNEDDKSYNPSDNKKDNEDKEINIVITDLCSPSSSKNSAVTLDSIQYDDKVQLHVDLDRKHRWQCLWCTK